MAPKKRKADENDEPAAKPVPVASRRMTRSATRLASSSTSSASTVPPPELPPKKKSKKEKAKPKKKDEEAKEVIAEDEKEAAGDAAAKTIVIEHCKQNKLFTTSANEVKDGLKTAVPGVTVLLNPDQPRMGCFEIREQDGETFISLLDMKRPFKPLKDLDTEKVVSDIVEKINS